METIITDLKVRLASGKTLELTTQEARELHAELARLFQLESPVPLIAPPIPGMPLWPTVPIIIPQQPSPQERHPCSPYPEWPPYWEVTYGTDTREPSCGISNTTLFIGGQS